MEEFYKVILFILNKHLIQIKKGGVIVFVKKLKSLTYLILQIPIYLLSIPAVIIVRLISPWFLIRWGELHSSRLGPFTVSTEIYCCNQDAGINCPSQRYVDLFYLKKYVCNKQLEKMWRRNLIILPAWLLFPLFKVNRFFDIFTTRKNYNKKIKEFLLNSYDFSIVFKKSPSAAPVSEEDFTKQSIHEVGSNNFISSDVRNLFEKFDPHIAFTVEEEAEGKRILKKFGIPENVKFVCLIVRDPGYLNRHTKYEFSPRNWNYHNFRNGDIDKFVLAAEELAKKGYYVFRMGGNVLKPLNSSNPKVIDYANSKMRSQFMDIYLGAKCNFSISTGTGFDGISNIFRRPIAQIIVPIGWIASNHKNNLIITKHHINQINQEELTISMIFSHNLAFSEKEDEFVKSKIKLKDNSPEEIRDLVIEMDERLCDRWKETEEDLLHQKNFWIVFNENIKKLNFKNSIHGKIRSKFGAKFLRENQDWIK